MSCIVTSSRKFRNVFDKINKIFPYKSEATRTAIASTCAALIEEAGMAPTKLSEEQYKTLAHELMENTRYEKVNENNIFVSDFLGTKGNPAYFKIVSDNGSATVTKTTKKDLKKEGAPSEFIKTKAQRKAQQDASVQFTTKTLSGMRSNMYKEINSVNIRQMTNNIARLFSWCVDKEIQSEKQRLGYEIEQQTEAVAQKKDLVERIEKRIEFAAGDAKAAAEDYENRDEVTANDMRQAQVDLLAARTILDTYQRQLDNIDDRQAFIASKGPAFWRDKIEQAVRKIQASAVLTDFISDRQASMLDNAFGRNSYGSHFQRYLRKGPDYIYDGIYTNNTHVLSAEEGSLIRAIEKKYKNKEAFTEQDLADLDKCAKHSVEVYFEVIRDFWDRAVKYLPALMAEASDTIRKSEGVILDAEGAFVRSDTEKDEEQDEDNEDPEESQSGDSSEDDGGTGALVDWRFSEGTISPFSTASARIKSWLYKIVDHNDQAYTDSLKAAKTGMRKTVKPESAFTRMMAALSPALSPTDMLRRFSEFAKANPDYEEFYQAVKASHEAASKDEFDEQAVLFTEFYGTFKKQYIQMITTLSHALNLEEEESKKNFTQSNFRDGKDVVTEGWGADLDNGVIYTKKEEDSIVKKNGKLDVKAFNAYNKALRENKALLNVYRLEFNRGNDPLSSFLDRNGKPFYEDGQNVSWFYRNCSMESKEVFYNIAYEGLLKMGFNSKRRLPKPIRFRKLYLEGTAETKENFDNLIYGFFNALTNGIPGFYNLHPSNGEGGNMCSDNNLDYILPNSNNAKVNGVPNETIRWLITRDIYNAKSSGDRNAVGYVYDLNMLSEFRKALSSFSHPMAEPMVQVADKRLYAYGVTNALSRIEEGMRIVKPIEERRTVLDTFSPEAAKRIFSEVTDEEELKDYRNGKLDKYPKVCAINRDKFGVYGENAKYAARDKDPFRARGKYWDELFENDMFGESHGSNNLTKEQEAEAFYKAEAQDKEDKFLRGYTARSLLEYRGESFGGRRYARATEMQKRAIETNKASRRFHLPVWSDGIPVYAVDGYGYFFEDKDGRIYTINTEYFYDGEFLNPFVDAPWGDGKMEVNFLQFKGSSFGNKGVHDVTPYSKMTPAQLYASELNAAFDGYIFMLNESDAPAVDLVKVPDQFILRRVSHGFGGYEFNYSEIISSVFQTLRNDILADLNLYNIRMDRKDHEEELKSSRSAIQRLDEPNVDPNAIFTRHPWLNTAKIDFALYLDRTDANSAELDEMEPMTLFEAINYIFDHSSLGSEDDLYDIATTALIAHIEKRADDELYTLTESFSDSDTDLVNELINTGGVGKSRYRGMNLRRMSVWDSETGDNIGIDKTGRDEDLFRIPVSYLDKSMEGVAEVDELLAALRDTAEDGYVSAKNYNEALRQPRTATKRNRSNSPRSLFPEDWNRLRTLVDRHMLLKTQQGRRDGSKMAKGWIRHDLNLNEYMALMKETLLPSITQIMTGGTYFYKDQTDLQKRNKQVHSPIQPMNTDSHYGRKYGREVTLDDNYIVPLAIKEMKLAINATDNLTDADKAVITNILEDTNVTDAQAYSSVSAHRAMMDMNGKWNKQLDEKYNKLINGEEVYLDPKKDIMPILKTFYYDVKAEHDGQGNTFSHPQQFKHSVKPLLQILSKIPGATQKSPILEGLSKWMEYNRIDLVQFKSAKKVGLQGVIPLKEDSNQQHDKNFSSADDVIAYLEAQTGLNNRKMLTIEEMRDPNNIQDETVKQALKIKNGTVHEFNYSNFGLQQNTDGSAIDTLEKIGAQLQKMADADFLGDDANLQMGFGKGEKMNKEQWREAYSTILGALIAKQAQEVFSKYTSKQSVIEGIVDSLLRNQKMSSRTALAMDPRSMEEVNQALSLLDPAQGTAIVQEFMTGIRKKLTAIEIPGCALVQMTSYGLSSDLKINFKDSDGNIVTSNSLIEDLKNETQISGELFALREQYDRLITSGHTSQADDVMAKQILPMYAKSRGFAIESIECYMPAYSKEILEACAKKDSVGNVIGYDMAKLEDMAPELLRCVGFRTPTEDKYSMMPLKIKGFVPVVDGKTIMLPVEITSLTGSDFDVDKMHIMLPKAKIVRRLSRATQNAVIDEYMRQNEDANILSAQYGIRNASELRDFLGMRKKISDEINALYEKYIQYSDELAGILETYNLNSADKKKFWNNARLIAQNQLKNSRPQDVNRTNVLLDLIRQNREDRQGLAMANRKDGPRDEAFTIALGILHDALDWGRQQTRLNSAFKTKTRRLKAVLDITTEEILDAASRLFRGEQLSISDVFTTIDESQLTPTQKQAIADWIDAWNDIELDTSDFEYESAVRYVKPDFSLKDENGQYKKLQDVDKDVLTNSLLELVYGMLSSPQHIAKQLNPGNFENYKTYAKIYGAVSVEKLKDAGFSYSDIVNNTDKVKEYAKENSKSVTPQYTESLFMINQHQSNHVGKDELAIAASGASAHAILQRCNLKQNAHVVINGRELTEIDGTLDLGEKDVNGVIVKSFISKACGTAVAASADNGKTPTLSALNLTPATSNFAFFLLRSGLKQSEVFYILQHPLVKELYSDPKKTPSRDEVLEFFWGKFIENAIDRMEDPPKLNEIKRQINETIKHGLVISFDALTFDGNYDELNRIASLVYYASEMGDILFKRAMQYRSDRGAGTSVAELLMKVTANDRIMSSPLYKYIEDIDINHNKEARKLVKDGIDNGHVDFDAVFDSVLNPSDGIRGNSVMELRWFTSVMPVLYTMNQLTPFFSGTFWEAADWLRKNTQFTGEFKSQWQTLEEDYIYYLLTNSQAFISKGSIEATRDYYLVKSGFKNRKGEDESFFHFCQKFISDVKNDKFIARAAKPGSTPLDMSNPLLASIEWRDLDRIKFEYTADYNDKGEYDGQSLKVVDDTEGETFNLRKRTTDTRQTSITGDEIREAWLDMYNSPEEDIQRFARELYLYCLIRNGCKFGAFEIGRYAPEQLKMEVERVNEYLHGVNDINSRTAGQGVAQDFAIQFAIHHPSLVSARLSKEAQFQVLTDASGFPTQIIVGKGIFPQKRVVNGKQIKVSPFFLSVNLSRLIQSIPEEGEDPACLLQYIEDPRYPNCACYAVIDVDMKDRKANPYADANALNYNGRNAISRAMTTSAAIAKIPAEVSDDGERSSGNSVDRFQNGLTDDGKTICKG